MPRNMVLIGGGTGSFALLTGLRDFPVELCSIVTMMDSGGDSGVLRDAYGVLPPGDLRRCLVALADQSDILRDLFSFRFEEPPLTGRNFGNLFFLALTRSLGSEREAVDAIGKLLNIRGRALPVTWDHAHLVAELEDGEVIAGEANIDGRGNGAVLAAHDPNVAIRRVYLEPEATANPEALTRIETCDVVVLAPGDLFTSTLPNLLVRGIPEAIARTAAPLVYVMNLMTKHGETDGYTASRHVEQIASYCGRVPDAVLVHDGELPEALLRRYESEQSSPVAVDAARMLELGVGRVFSGDLTSSESLVRHDPKRTARELLALVEALSPRPAAARRAS